ncbi:MAG: phosphoenolpyruvate synthase [Bacteroidaceae bacterium]|nr:phosphoenolpyruvate synthase [Bacteroidaceae bacterium]
MSQIPRLKDVAMKDTPFADLMNRRIYNIMLLSSKYDAFMLEDDGRVDEEIFNEYTHLGLRYPPRFTQVTTRAEAMELLKERNFELIIVLPNMDKKDIFDEAKEIKAKYPSIPIVVLTPFSKEVTRRLQHDDLSSIDYVFSWLGDPQLLVAIVKLIEDKWNAPHDCASVGVQIILLVEDSVRFYSSALTHLFRYVLEQSQFFAGEALNEQLKTMRMRGRPKVMLARSYEEAVALYELYKDRILGVVSDMSFEIAGTKDPQAGYKLGQYIRATDRYLPIIYESNQESTRELAATLDADFISKNSKSYPQDLRRAVRRGFGFGDFVVTDPSTGEELMRLATLKDLQHNVFSIPDEAMRYHLQRNHFSRFFFSRAMFPPAVILKHVDVDEYQDMNEARQLVFDLIMNYRRLKNEGVLANYRQDMFDEYSHFARMGRGSLGGKGRGLAFIAQMLRRYPRLETDNMTVRIPKTVVVCTDHFDAFMENANLYDIALSETSDEEMLQAFEAAPLPELLVSDLRSYLQFVSHPVAVRSSSVLEDAHYQPFAGVYATYMVPITEDKEQSLEALCKAIKAVYASVFYHDSKAYMQATQNVIDQEKMAVVLQEVVGSVHDNLFYPTLSGVARSLNFYPIGDEKAEDGVASVALGLGKYIVDGGVTLKFSPAHPRHVLQLSSTDMALRETQRRFYALDLTQSGVEPGSDDGYNLRDVAVRDAAPPVARQTGALPAATDKTLKYIFSTYDPDSDMLWEGCQPRGRKVVTFANILQHEAFPMARTVSKLLEIGQKEMGRPVEIEFAMNIRPDGTYADFYLLQIRPIVDSKQRVDEDLSLIAESDTIVSSQHVLGNGITTDVDTIVYVKNQAFDAAHNPQIAQEIAHINDRLLQVERGYVLIGPGRWGSSDPWLGVPVKWSNICGARVIVEQGLKQYQVDPSQGTHFFQNLTSFGVGYFTINPFRGDGYFDEALLNALPAEEETEHVRVVKLPAPCVIKMDGRRGRGVVMKCEE